MSDDGSFQDLLQRLRERDQEAALEFVRRYEPFVRRAVRARLIEAGMTSLLDSADVCQSVLATFFLRWSVGQYEVTTPGELLKLLTAMARNKLRHHVRQQHAGRRDRRRLRDAGASVDNLASETPGPLQQLAAHELLQEAYRRMTPEERLLAELRNDGLDWAAIAARVGSEPVRLRKQLSRALDRVTRELRLDDDPDE